MIERRAVALPLIHWHGWRPTFLDFAPDERGGQVLLLLAHDDERALLPCAELRYVYYTPESDEGQEDLRVTFSDAVREADLLALVQRLESEGWTVIGRLEAAFIGRFTEEAFWEKVECRRCQPSI